MDVFDQITIAENYLDRALQLRKNLAKNGVSKELSESYHVLGDVYLDQGKYLEALKMYEKALEIKKQVYGEHHVLVATTYHNMGNISLRQGKKKQAHSLFSHACDIFVKVLGKEHPSTRVAKLGFDGTK